MKIFAGIQSKKRPPLDPKDYVIINNDKIVYGPFESYEEAQEALNENRQQGDSITQVKHLKTKLFARSLESKNDSIIKVVRSEFEFKTTRLEEDLNTIIVNKKPLLVRSIIETKAGYILVGKDYNTTLVKEFESKVPYLENIAKEMLKEFKTDKLEISVSPGNGIRIYPYDELHEDPSLSKEKDEFFQSLDKTRKIASKYGLIDRSGYRLPNYDFPLK